MNKLRILKLCDCTYDLIKVKSHRLTIAIYYLASGCKLTQMSVRSGLCHRLTFTERAKMACLSLSASPACIETYPTLRRLLLVI